ncbi:alpha/beta fold hydrolase [Streptomyces thermolilacinus]|uniref:alpha/beta fold hydrolase n=1 Tax=Streptomyces thermolilacinus TaxID=285540 RepID=UPI0033C649AD
MTRAVAPTAPVRGRVTSADGTVVAYERRGEGPPLVLVGGALSPRRGEWRLAGLLAERFTTYTYDRRGPGGGAAGCGPEREVDDLAALVAEAGPGAGVHGLPSGGALVLAAAAGVLPVARLSVYEPPYGEDDDAHDGVPSELLARVRQRVLVLDGGASPRWPRGAARAVARALPHARHGTLTGQPMWWPRTPWPRSWRRSTRGERG